MTKQKNELDAITFSLQAQEQQLKNVQEYFRGQITATQQSTTEIKANTTAQTLLQPTPQTMLINRT